MPYKLLIISFLLFSSCNAGIIKSAISKTQDKIDLIKNTDKETDKNSMAKENIEFVQRTKTQIKNTLIEKSLN